MAWTVMNILTPLGNPCDEMVWVGWVAEFLRELSMVLLLAMMINKIKLTNQQCEFVNNCSKHSADSQSSE